MKISKILTVESIKKSPKLNVFIITTTTDLFGKQDTTKKLFDSVFPRQLNIIIQQAINCTANLIINKQDLICSNLGKTHRV